MWTCTGSFFPIHHLCFVKLALPLTTNHSPLWYANLGCNGGPSLHDALGEPHRQRSINYNNTNTIVVQQFECNNYQWRPEQKPFFFFFFFFI